MGVVVFTTRTALQPTTCFAEQSIRRQHRSPCCCCCRRCPGAHSFGGLAATPPAQALSIPPEEALKEEDFESLSALGWAAGRIAVSLADAGAHVRLACTGWLTLAACAGLHCRTGTVPKPAEDPLLHPQVPVAWGLSSPATSSGWRSSPQCSGCPRWGSPAGAPGPRPAPAQAPLSCSRAAVQQRGCLGRRKQPGRPASLATPAGGRARGSCRMTSSPC